MLIYMLYPFAAGSVSIWQGLHVLLSLVSLIIAQSLAPQSRSWRSACPRVIAAAVWLFSLRLILISVFGLPLQRHIARSALSQQLPET